MGIKVKNELEKLNRLCISESKYYFNNIDLVAASNFLRLDISNLKYYTAQRSMEGLLNKRPYAGTKFLDKIEKIGSESAKRIFKAEHANIQPHSGSQANQIAYTAFLNPGDKILSMRFDNGGHLTHGNPINFSGKIYKFKHYSINPTTQLLDYDKILEIAKSFRPKMIIAGASSYPRVINYRKIGIISKKIGAFFMADISHPSGLIAAKLFPSPFPYADVVTTTTEKTLWGPHAAIIMCKNKYSKIVDKAVHPGTQSSVPIARVVQICRALLFAETKKFNRYAINILKNAKILEKEFKKIKNCIVFGGTDSHFIVINTKSGFGLIGKQAEKILEDIGIFTNRQIIPWEDENPFKASGLRIGVTAATSRGFEENDFKVISKIIIEALSNFNDKIKINNLKKEVISLIKNIKSG